MEHVKRPHPFRVTLSQIVVHGYNVHTVTSQSVKEYGERTHQGFTFTRCHFSNLTLVQYHTTKELNIIVHHIPFSVITTSNPMVLIDSLIAFDGYKVVACSQFAVKVVSRNLNGFVLSKAASGILHNGKNLGECVIERNFHFVEHLRFKFINLAKDYLAVFDGCVLYLRLEFINFLLDVISRMLNGVLNLFRFGT